MYLYGAGGHARVVADILAASGVRLDGFIDDDTALECFMEFPVWHDAAFRRPVIVSIGDNYSRMVKTLQLEGDYGTAVHPAAVLAPDTSVGEGSVIVHGAVIQAGARIGRHCIINTSSVVDHEAVVGDYAHVAVGASLCGRVTVGEGTLIGAGSTVIPGVRIGKWAVIGAGAAVISDIPDFSIAVGNPAKVINFVGMDKVEKINRISRGGDFDYLVIRPAVGTSAEIKRPAC